MTCLLKFKKLTMSFLIKNLKNIMIKTILFIHVSNKLHNNPITIMKILGINNFIVKWKVSITMISKRRKRRRGKRLILMSRQNKGRNFRIKSNWRERYYLRGIQYGSKPMHIWTMKKGKEGSRKSKNNSRNCSQKVQKYQVHLKNGSFDYHHS